MLNAVVIIIHNLYTFIYNSSSKKQGWCGNDIGTAVNATCQENLVAYHFGHTCHRFVICLL
jgi:hypothetical protein